MPTMTTSQRRTTRVLIGSIATAAAISLAEPVAVAETSHLSETSSPTNASAMHDPPATENAAFGPEGQFQGRFLYNGVRMRTGPGTQYAIKGLAYRGQRWLGPSNISRTVTARVYCPPGRIFRWSNHWKLVYNPQNRVKGWVNSCYYE